jgi:hypothetical protein
MNVAATYPKLEEWRDFYCNPNEPEVIGREMLHIHPEDTEETILQRLEEENEKIRNFCAQEKKLLDAYYELMQPLLFNHLPALHQLEGDYWVIYAMTIRDAYEEWKTLSEEMETTIESDMPQESIAWDYADWNALYTKKWREKHHKLPT